MVVKMYGQLVFAAQAHANRAPRLCLEGRFTASHWSGPRCRTQGSDGPRIDLALWRHLSGCLPVELSYL